MSIQAPEVIREEGPAPAPLSRERPVMRTRRPTTPTWRKPIRLDQHTVLLFLVGVAALTTAVQIFLYLWGPFGPPTDSDVAGLCAPYVRGEFVAKFKLGTSLEEIRKHNRNVGAQEVGYDEGTRVFRLKVNPVFTELKMVELYNQHPDIEVAALNCPTDATPSPPS